MKSKFLIPMIIAVIFGLAACKSTKFATDCSTLKLDVYKGKMNNTKPTASPEEVKTAFTCYTGESEEGTSFNCGGGVFFLDDDFFFYTYRDYIEVRDNFTGEFVNSPLIRTSREDIEAKFGTPVMMPDDDTYLYGMKYGTLRIEFDNDYVFMIGIHYQSPEEVKLCR